MSAPNPRLAGSDVEYRTLANALPQIIWTTDAQGRLEWVNDRWYELTGLSEEESLYNKGALAAVHPDDHALLERTWREALATSTPCEIEYRIRNREGAYRWHLARAAPIRDQNNVVTRWVSGVMDMHERRIAEQQLHEWERRFEVVFNVIPHATAIIRLSDGAHLQVNDAFTRVTGFTRSDIIGQSTVTLGMWTAEERAAHIAPLVTPPGGSTVVPFRTKDGKPLRLSLSGRHLGFGGEPCMVTIAVDVTEQEANEAALLEADRRKDEFLALLSHELRNPLTPILTATRLLKLRGAPEMHADLDVITRQAGHLARLVDDLLDVSRASRGKVLLAKQRVELSSIVANAVEATGPLLEKRQHVLEVSVALEGLAVDADEVRLTQVVSNLLSNAAQFTPPGGKVTVVAERDVAEVVLRVRDTGVGIDPALLPNLFEMFVQGQQSVERKEGGLGLGLSLARTLTELHGGTLTATSDGIGRGSVFEVRLPAAVSASASAGLAATSHSVFARVVGDAPRVLIVDDNNDVADTVSRLLSIAGYDTRTTNEAASALALSTEFRPQVAILDIGLPGMDGYQLARELRALLSENPPIFIALTGYTRDRDRERSREAGFALHLAKPIDGEKLVHILDAVSTRDSARP